MKLSKKLIVKTITEKFNLPSDSVELVKTDGFYYFAGDITIKFKDSNTYLQKLSDNTLEEWVLDFELKYEEVYGKTGSGE